MKNEATKPRKSTPLKTTLDDDLNRSIFQLSKLVLWVIGGIGLVMIGAFWYWVIHWLFKVW
jgi:hypothetical protein